MSIITFFLLVFWTFISFYTLPILKFLTIDEEIAIRTDAMMRITVYFIPLQAINQILQTFVSSQEVTLPFNISNIISIFISIYFGRKFIIDDNYREIGFCYTRIVQELFNVIFSSCVFFFYVKKDTLLPPSWKLICTNFYSDFKYTVKTAFGFYGECLSFEVNTYFAAMMHNITELAAYVAIINCVVYVFFISIGLANTIRVVIGKTLGEKNINKARKDSIIYVLSILLLSVIFVVLVMIFRWEIALIYTGHNDATPIVAMGLLIYCTNVFPTFILYSLSTVMRYLDKNTLAVFSTTIIMPILVILISGFLCFNMKMGALGLIWGFFLSKSVAVIIYFVAIYTADWPRAYSSFLAKDKESKLNQAVEDTTEIELVQKK